MELIKGAAELFPGRVDRRHAPRLTPESTIRGEVFGSTAGITITDASYGGLRMQATTPFWQGTRHVIHADGGPGQSVELLAQVVYCHRAVTDRGAPCFVVGWEFLPGPGADEAAARLVDLVSGDAPFGLVS